MNLRKPVEIRDYWINGIISSLDRYITAVNKMAI